MTNGVDAKQTSASVQVSGPAQQSVVGALSGLLSDLKSAPILLLIVILNAAFVGAGAWYLLKVEEYRANDRQMLGAILDKCIAQSVPVDYLLRMQQPRSP